MEDKFTADQFEKMIYNALNLDRDVWFTANIKKKSAKGIKGVSITVECDEQARRNKISNDGKNSGVKFPLEAKNQQFTCSINDNLELEFSDSISDIKKAKITIAFRKYFKQEKLELTPAAQEALDSLKILSLYSQLGKEQSVKVLQIPTMIFSSLVKNTALVATPCYNALSKKPKVGDIVCVENDLITSRFAMAKSRPFLVTAISKDGSKRIMAVPISSKNTDAKKFGEDSICSISTKFYNLMHENDKKAETNYLLFARTEFLGLDKVKSIIGRVDDRQALKEFMKKASEYIDQAFTLKFNPKDEMAKSKKLPAKKEKISELKTSESTEKSESLSNNLLNSESLENKKGLLKEETKVEKIKEETVNQDDVFVPLNEKELGSFYKSGTLHCTGNILEKIDYKNIPFQKYLNIFEVELKKLFAQGMQIGGIKCKMMNSAENKQASFEPMLNETNPDAASTSYAITFNASQKRFSQNHPKITIEASAFRVKLGHNTNKPVFNNLLTQKFNNIMQNSWAFYYVYLAYNILQVAKQNKWNVEDVKQQLYGMGLKYDGNLKDVISNPKLNFKPELVYCYKNYFDCPEDEKE